MDTKGIFAGILSELGLNTREFADSIGYSLTKLYDIQRGKTKRLGDDLVALISEKYPKFNRVWLLTGEGDMLKPVIQEPDTTHNEPALTTIDTRKVKPIPLVTQTAVAGFGNANFCIAEADVKDYYIVPKFRYHKVDFMIEISGSSMYPKYNSGDVVACTILRDGAFIQWNKCHIVATREQGILCKRIMPGSTDDRLKMVSDNADYPVFEVPKAEITGIALVVGVIRLE